MALKYIDIERIIDVDKTQARAGYVSSVIDEYADHYADPEQFLMPPIYVVKVPGTRNYWIIDGHHRYKAAVKAGKGKIYADVDDLKVSQSLTLDAALLRAARQNTEHGLQRTPDDKRKAVEIFLTKGDADYTDQYIARQVVVSNKLVSKVRKELEESGTIAIRERPVEKAARAVADPNNADKSNREIASEAGVDEKTIRKVRNSGTFQDSAPATQSTDPDQEALDAVSLSAQEFVKNRKSDVPSDDPENFDRQERPSILNVTDETRRVTPEVEKPKAVAKEAAIQRMINVLRKEPNVKIDRNEPLEIVVVKLYAVLWDRPEAWSALPDMLRNFKEVN